MLNTAPQCFDQNMVEVCPRFSTGECVKKAIPLKSAASMREEAEELGKNQLSQYSRYSVLSYGLDWLRPCANLTRGVVQIRINVMRAHHNTNTTRARCVDYQTI